MREVLEPSIVDQVLDCLYSMYSGNVPSTPEVAVLKCFSARQSFGGMPASETNLEGLHILHLG